MTKTVHVGVFYKCSLCVQVGGAGVSSPRVRGGGKEAGQDPPVCPGPRRHHCSLVQLVAAREFGISCSVQ
jgi:hypothetical protein